MLDFLLEKLSPASSLLTVVALILGTIFIISSKTWRGPGPWGIPLLGFYPFLRPDCHIQLMELAKKYGDAYLLSLGGQRYVHLGNYKALREAFVTKAEFFSERGRDFSIFELLFGGGIFLADDEAWRVWRKFLGKSMRELGIGPKEQLRGPIFDSAEAVLEVLRKSNGSPVDISSLLSTQCVEVVRRLILGKDVTPETSQQLCDSYRKTFEVVTSGGVLLYGKLARWLLLPRCSGYKEMMEGKKELESTLRNIVATRKASYNDEHPEDLIGFYFSEKKALEAKGNPQAKYFTEDALVATLILVYGDGSTSIAALIANYLRVLASKPDLQEAIYNEVSTEIGTNRMPSYEDRSRLPFTNSAIREMERTSEFITIIPSSKSSRDTSVCGVFVPKGTMTIFNIYAVNNDPDVFKEPERFDPKRFMPADDNNERSKVENPVLFGLGKRACGGESLVMTEVLVFITAILQQFTLQLDVTEKDFPKGASRIPEALECRVLAFPRKHV